MKRVKGQKVKEKCKERKENTEKVSEISLKKEKQKGNSMAVDINKMLVLI